MKRAAPLAVLLAAPCAFAEPKAPCDGRAGEIVIRAAEHKLYLCEEGAAAARSFSVAFGRGGTDKRSDGDLKTPLGAYPLGAPRASKQYHLFIPVGYPTAAQQAKGFTGKNIGIHGPRRNFKWAGRINNWVDWTRGCIAVADDGAIDAIVSWVKKQAVRRVRIE